ncbi:MAG: AraC family transcriptional regulator [Spirochaetota bacterium]
MSNFIHISYYPFIAEDNPPHGHAYWETVIVLKGSGITVAEETEYPLKPRTIIAFPPKYRHADRLRGAYGCYVIGARDFPGVHNLVHAHDNGTITGMAHLLYREFHRKHRGWRESCESILACMQSIQLLNRCAVVDDEAVSRFEDIIIEHIHAPNFNIRRSLSTLPISPTRMFARFKKARGVSPRQYLINLRLREAATLLTTTDIPIDVIANRLGFFDRYHFSRIFKQKIGYSPGYYRK